MSSKAQDSDHLKVRPNYPHLSVGIGIAAIAHLIYSSLQGILNEPALSSIAVFNLLFVFTLFPLDARAHPKVGAVQGRVTVLNEPNTLVTRLVALERTGGYRVDQFARSSLGLIPQFGGTIVQWRYLPKTQLKIGYSHNDIHIILTHCCF